MILLILLLTLLGICLLHLTLLSKNNRNRLLLILPVLCPADHNLHSLSCLIILQFSNQIRTTGNRHTVKLDNYIPFLDTGCLRWSAFFYGIHKRTQRNTVSLCGSRIHIQTGSCSRYEFARTILEYSGKAGELDLYPVVIEDSARPTYSVLDNMMLRLTGIEEPKDWKAALKEYLDETGGLE